MTGKSCLVVGCGLVGRRRAKVMLNTQAKVSLIDPVAIDDEALIQAVLGSGGDIIHANFDDAMLGDYDVVVVATNQREVNQRVVELAKAARRLVNVADDQTACDFIFPAIVDRHPVTIAISSNGNSPVLSRSIKNRIDALLPRHYGRLAVLLGKFRDEVKSAFSTSKQIKSFWEDVLTGTVAESIFVGNEKKAEKLLREKIAEKSAKQGEVYLIGVGPGDPDLLSFRALRLIHQADVVLYDRLVAPEIVELCSPDSEKIYVGKQRSNHAKTQDEINQLLVDYGLKGKKVARLKGGDPFIFGRGGEEVQEIEKYGLPIQVVPGITAASGCSSYAGIPLTHRDYAQSVRFVTAHLKAEEKGEIPWHELTGPNQTLVFYMGLTSLAMICDKLTTHGLPGDTPIALIEKGTMADQKVYTGDLNTLPSIVSNHTVASPSLIIVGHVVRLHKKDVE